LYTLNVVVTRPSRGWCHWQAQQAERSEKVTEDEQQELAGGSSEGGDLAVVVVLVVLVVVLVLLPVDASVGQRNPRSRNGSEAEDEQTWRTR
jgi:predicted metalloprotease